MTGMFAFTVILLQCSSIITSLRLSGGAARSNNFRVTMTSDKVAQMPLKVAVAGAGVGG